MSLLPSPFHSKLEKVKNSGFFVKSRVENANTNWAIWSFTAKKGHVSIRGKWRSNCISYFDVFARTVHGGYAVRYRLYDVDDAIEKATEIYENEEAPKVPKFSPDELPDPYGFDTTLKMVDIGSGTVKYESHASYARCMYIASFDDKLFVSPASAMHPNRDAWFVFEIQGTNCHRIITTGDGWLLLRRSTKERWRVAFNKPISLDYIDKAIINAAIESYVAKSL